MAHIQAQVGGGGGGGSRSSYVKPTSSPTSQKPKTTTSSTSNRGSYESDSSASLAAEAERQRKNQEYKNLIGGIENASKRILEASSDLVNAQNKLLKYAAGFLSLSIQSAIATVQEGISGVVNNLNSIATTATEKLTANGEPTTYNNLQPDYNAIRNAGGMVLFSCNTESLRNDVLPVLSDAVNKLENASTTSSTLPKLEGCENISTVSPELDDKTKAVKAAYKEVEEMVNYAEEAEKRNFNLIDALSERIKDIDILGSLNSNDKNASNKNVNSDSSKASLSSETQESGFNSFGLLHEISAQKDFSEMSQTQTAIDLLASKYDVSTTNGDTRKPTFAILNEIESKISSSSPVNTDDILDDKIAQNLVNDIKNTIYDYNSKHVSSIKKKPNSVNKDYFSNDITFTADYVKEDGYIPYSILTPSTVSDGEPKPLIVWLHGDGNRNQSETVFVDHRYNLTHIIQESELSNFDAYVISPHLTGSYDLKYWCSDKGEQYLRDLLDKFISEHNVDTSKIIVSGASLGGQGTVYMADHMSDYFAKAVPVSGYGSMTKPEDITIPIKGYVGETSAGEDDGAVKYMKGTLANGIGKENVTSVHASHGKAPTVVFNLDEDGNGRSDVIEWMLSDIDVHAQLAEEAANAEASAQATDANTNNDNSADED